VAADAPFEEDEEENKAREREKRRELNIMLRSVIAESARLPSSEDVAKLVEGKPEAERREFAGAALSSSLLTDKDMPFVLRIVRAHPACGRVNLAFNYFTKDQASTSGLLEILKLPQVKYVVIVGNPLASFDGKDFLQGLDDAHLRKLIWISRIRVDGESWTKLVKAGKADLVRQSHAEYYETYGDV
jgi:hypothetical protein